ncbi:unnamed protein product [Linum trigynum]|uniref:Pentatricopeptide repeat-containing protein n=1 Tax=Linum trigynum TaxID=586398 RepID=A0AAV2FL26_9ROSI
MEATSSNSFDCLRGFAPTTNYISILRSASLNPSSSSIHGAYHQSPLQYWRCSGSSGHSSEIQQAESFTSLLKITKYSETYRDGGSKQTFVNCASLIQNLRKEGMPHLAHEVFLEMKSEGFLPDSSTLCALMLCYADNGLFPHAQAIWDEMLNSSFTPTIDVVSDLMLAYGKKGLYEEVAKIVDQLSLRHTEMLPKVYPLAISCYGQGGQLELMESTVNQMVSKGFKLGSSVANAFLRYYSIHGSLTEMEAAYHRVKRSRVLIEEEGIRAMSSAYMRQRKFYQLGEFVRDVGLRRRNVGNLLWNLLLVSYAANFKMKSLQREFVSMLDSGFHPDLTTFNIRAMAFLKMSLLWDLHLSLEHMRHCKVDPDLVTIGCVVDAYLDKRLGRNLEFAFRKLNLDESPAVLTDPFLFEVLGKGDFHASSEAFMEFRKQRNWSYKDLLAIYVRKQHRSNQIFWNY